MEKNFNHEIWLLSHTIQCLTHANTNSELGLDWLKSAIENVNEVCENLKKELPF